jgi:hypothetical protein
MQIGDFIDLLSICYVLIHTDQNVFFSNFTTVIVINFEADYLLIHWTCRDMGDWVRFKFCKIFGKYFVVLIGNNCDPDKSGTTFSDLK